MTSNKKDTMEQVKDGKTRELLNFSQFALKPRTETYLQAEVLTGEHLLVTEQSSEPQHAAPERGKSWFSTGSFLEAGRRGRCIHCSKPKFALAVDSGADRRYFRDKDKASPWFS